MLLCVLQNKFGNLHDYAANQIHPFGMRVKIEIFLLLHIKFERIIIIKINQIVKTNTALWTLEFHEKNRSFLRGKVAEPRSTRTKILHTTAARRPVRKM